MFVLVVLMLTVFSIVTFAYPIKNLAAPNPNLTTINPAFMLTPEEAQEWYGFKDLSNQSDFDGPSWRSYVDFLYGKLIEYGAADFIEIHRTYNLPAYNDWLVSKSPLELTINNNNVAVSIPVASYTSNSGSTKDMPGGVLTAAMLYYDSTQGAPAPGAWAGKIVVLKTRPQPPAIPYFQSYLDNFTASSYDYRMDSYALSGMFELVPFGIINSFNTLYQLAEQTTFRDWAISGQAAAMVIVSDLPWDTAVGLNHYAEEFSVPSLFLDAVNGATAISHAQLGQTASLKLICEWTPADIYNIVCFLPGKYYGTDQDEYIVLDTHADIMTPAQENGELGVLGTVKYFSRIPQAERLRTLLLYIDNRYFLSGAEQSWDAQDILQIYPELQAKPFAKVGYVHLGQLEAFDADLFVKQLTTTTQIVSELMVADDATSTDIPNMVNGAVAQAEAGTAVSLNDDTKSGTALEEDENTYGVDDEINLNTTTALVEADDRRFMTYKELMRDTQDLVEDDPEPEAEFFGQMDDYWQLIDMSSEAVQDDQLPLIDAETTDNEIPWLNAETTDNEIPQINAKTTVSLSGDTFLTGGEVARYAVSVYDVFNLNTATVWFEALNPYLTGREFNGLNGFSLLGEVGWSENGDVWIGRATLVNTGVITTSASLEIFEMLFNTSPNNLGAAYVKLNQVQLSGVNTAGEPVFIDATVNNGFVQTVVNILNIKYDVNKDGKVDQLDLGASLIYYMVEEGDANWEIAQRADVNNDGRTDTEDLILILNSIAW